MLINLSIRDFLAETASNNPVPGGGSIAALSGAIAAGLSEMVANLTIGKKGFEKYEADMKKISRKASELRKKLVNDIDKDANAFDEVMASYRLPKNSENEKIKRNSAIQTALKKAAIIPLGVANDAYKVAQLAETAVNKGNRNAVTDGTVGAMMARTAVLSALLNVKINLASITDEVFVNKTIKEVDRLEHKILEKEKQILSKVEL